MAYRLKLYSYLLLSQLDIVRVLVRCTDEILTLVLGDTAGTVWIGTQDGG